jgi:hypothetical protein
MCHREIHNQSVRRRKSVDMFLGFLQDYIVLCRAPVKPLIEFDMSIDDLHHDTNHNEKSCMHTGEEVQSEVQSDVKDI